MAPITSTMSISRQGQQLVEQRLTKRGLACSRGPVPNKAQITIAARASATPVLVEVRTNLRPKAGGGKGAMALDWYFSDVSEADWIAFFDLSSERVWLLTKQEAFQFAQQHASGKYHFYMYVDPAYDADPTNHMKHFEQWLFDNRVAHLERQVSS